jgi:hypothetical protein
MACGAWRLHKVEQYFTRPRHSLTDQTTALRTGLQPYTDEPRHDHIDNVKVDLLKTATARKKRIQRIPENGKWTLNIS